MSMDILQEKIRKLKNPSVLELGFSTTAIPVHVREACASRVEALGVYSRMLLEGLKGQIPAVRIGFSGFALHGAEGIEQLQLTLNTAGDLGYYVLMDAPEIFSPAAAEACCDMLLGEGSAFRCDGVVISGYLGSDILKKFLPYCKKAKKSVFVVVRTGNKSAAELQDLLSGSRLVHAAAADHVNRCGSGTAGKAGYLQMGIMVAANAADSLKSLRSKYPALFLLVDGYDYPNANAKNCSYAFDKFGHGAVVCAGNSISGAWLQEETDGTDCLEQAVNAAVRMKKNLTRYVTVL